MSTVNILVREISDNVDTPYILAVDVLLFWFYDIS